MSGADFRIARGLRIFIALSAAFVTLPSLAAGLYDDDLWQRRFLLDHLSGGGGDGWWRMFSVVAPKQNPALVDAGILPWWTSPDFQLSFFRPLSVATHYLDYWLWPQTTWLMHLQSTLWYVLLCSLVLHAYQRLTRIGGIAALAAFMYAIDDAHLEAAAWLSARNSIITAVFAVLTLVLFDEYARTRSTRYAMFAALALSLGHLSSEGAIAVWAYLVGGVAFFPSWRPRRRTLLGLIPCAMVSAGFAMLTTALDYRVVGSGGHIDPRVRPIEFAHAVLERLPVLLRAEFGPPAWLQRSIERVGLETPFAVLCVAVWLMVLWIGLPILRRKPELCGLLVGMLGSLLVACAARPEPRLLLLAGFGAHVVLATVIASAWESRRTDSGFRRNRSTVIVASLVLLHVATPLAASFTVPEWYRALHRARSAAAAQMQVGPEDSARTVAILNAPSYFDALSICTYRLDIAPRSWRSVQILGTSTRGVTLTRSAVNSLVLAPDGGYLLEPTSQQARSPDEPFAPGQTVSLDGLNVVVEATTPTGRPTRIRVELHPQHDLQVRFLNWDAAERTFVRVGLPEVGESVRL